ncbi:hypothetical protein BGZ95_011002 [Linnemannia exigua]|uniref:Uncharacterized protein n=1 Tax=Linnemannia exigua TaxID=604196 RepID=A0AAD4H6R1_9FUNG|nr:hypothetical protein BGZ95_011002 [Linnemannia exigua]
MRSAIIIASALALSTISSSVIAAPSSTDTLYSISDSSISVKCKACVYPAYIDSSSACSKESNPPSAKSATTKQHLACFDNFAKNKAWAQSCLTAPKPPPTTNTTATPPPKKACEQSEVNTFQGLVSTQAVAARAELAGNTTTITATVTTVTPTVTVNSTTTVPTITPTVNSTVPNVPITAAPSSTASSSSPSIVTGGSNNGASVLGGGSASGKVVVALSALLAMAAAGAL